MNKFSKMKVRWRTRNHCLFVLYFGQCRIWIRLDIGY